MIKGKSLIEPGYEADSKECGWCPLWEFRGRKEMPKCDVFQIYLKGFGNSILYRCKPCLESEVKQ